MFYYVDWSEELMKVDKTYGLQNGIDSEFNSFLEKSTPILMAYSNMLQSFGSQI